MGFPYQSADTSRDLVTLTFDLFDFEQLSCMVGHVTNLATKYEVWVMMFPVGYHWKCVRGHCACAKSRDPWVGGQKQVHFWNPRPRFAYSLYNFYWASTMIKGRLLSSVTNAKAPDCVNFFVRDCMTLTFDRLTLNSCLLWRVISSITPPSLRTLRLFLYELRVITVPIDYQWIFVRSHCACAESRDPWVGGQKRLHFWNPRPRYACSLYNFYCAPTTIKGRLLWSRPMLKPFTGEKILSLVDMIPKMMFFWENGSQNLRYWFRDPKRLFLARNHVIWRILRQNRCARLSCSLCQEPKSSWVTLCRGSWNHACAEPKPQNRCG